MILTPLGATFVTTANVVIGSTTVLLAAVTGATGTADSVVISAAFRHVVTYIKTEQNALL